MADSEKKIDEMFGLLHEMKPVVLDIREGQKSMDTRVRAIEVNVGVHAVKIDRIQTDLDGLGRKVRGIETRPPATSEGRWTDIVEFLGAIPLYWHVIGYAVTVGIAVVAVLRKS